MPTIVVVCPLIALGVICRTLQAPNSSLGLSNLHAQVNACIYCPCTQRIVFVTERVGYTDDTMKVFQYTEAQVGRIPSSSVNCRT